MDLPLTHPRDTIPGAQIRTTSSGNQARSPNSSQLRRDTIQGVQIRTTSSGNQARNPNSHNFVGKPAQEPIHIYLFLLRGPIIPLCGPLILGPRGCFFPGAVFPEGFPGNGAQGGPGPQARALRPWGPCPRAPLYGPWALYILVPWWTGFADGTKYNWPHTSPVNFKQKF